MKNTISAFIAALALIVPAHGLAAIGKPHTCTVPAELIASGHGGFVTVAFTITQQGTVTNLRVFNSSGFPELDSQALACVQEWRYLPATRNGQPVSSPWRAEVMLGDYAEAWASKGRLRAVADDIRKCVPDSLIAATPAAEEITDVRFTFPASGAPTARVEFSTASEALTRQVEECAQGSPSLAAAGKPGTTRGISFSWTNILRLRNK